jgi:hypothetical protein
MSHINTTLLWKNKRMHYTSRVKTLQQLRRWFCSSRFTFAHDSYKALSLDFVQFSFLYYVTPRHETSKNETDTAAQRRHW